VFSSSSWQVIPKGVGAASDCVGVSSLPRIVVLLHALAVQINDRRVGEQSAAGALREA